MGTRSTTGDGLWDIPIPQNEASQKKMDHQQKIK